MCAAPNDIHQDANKDQDTESDPETFTESEPSEVEEENICIRAKWSMDDASTIDEAVIKLNEFIEYLKSLKNDGWELREPIQDDYGFLYKT
jgi:hypothetical protein